LPQVPQSYAARTSPAWHYSSHVRPPEANYIVVTTVGDLLPGKRGNTAFTQFAYNQASYDFDGTRTMDPEHPDYLGRFVPLIYFNRLLGYGADETRIRFTGPLVLIDDVADTYLTQGNGVRPLRYYDPITFDGQPFLVHSVEMNIDSDFHQSAFYECLAVENTQVV
jgi:hypothetical protein